MGRWLENRKSQGLETAISVEEILANWSNEGVEPQKKWGCSGARASVFYERCQSRASLNTLTQSQKEINRTGYKNI